MIKLIKINGIPYVLNISKPDSRKAVIFSHGFYSNKNKAYTKSSARSLAIAGIKAVRFNYGTEDINERVAILKEVINHVSQDVDSIGLVGNSLGAMTLMLAIDNPKINSITLINPICDSEETYKNYKKARPKFWVKIMKHKIKKILNAIKLNKLIKDFVKKFTKPVLLISSEKDELVTPKQMKRLYLKLNGEKKIVNIRGCSHRIWFPTHVERVREEIREWFKNTL